MYTWTVSYLIEESNLFYREADKMETLLVEMESKPFDENYLNGTSLSTESDSINPNVGFICDVCGKSFKWKQHMNRHRRLHTGEKYVLILICYLGKSEFTYCINHSQTIQMSTVRHPICPFRISCKAYGKCSFQRKQL